MYEYLRTILNFMIFKCSDYFECPRMQNHKPYRYRQEAHKVSCQCTDLETRCVSRSSGGTENVIRGHLTSSTRKQYVRITLKCRQSDQFPLA